MRTLLLVLDLVGTFVFALSGATAGVKHRLDLFGVLVLSFAAGNSGGIEAPPGKRRRTDRQGKESEDRKAIERSVQDRSVEQREHARGGHEHLVGNGIALNSAMNSAARIEAFLEMMSAERGAAENTLSSYRRDLEDASEAIGGGLARAGAADIRAYLDDIAARGFAPTSQARKLSAIRQFFKFLYAEGLRGDDPTGTLDSPRKGRPLPKTMTEAETARLLDRAAEEAGGAAPDGDRLAALRLHALVEVLYATGLRVSELVGLPVTVALRDDRFFMVRGKGDKERMVPLSAKARTAMRAWLAARAERPAGFLRQRPSLPAGLCPRS